MARVKNPIAHVKVSREDCLRLERILVHAGAISSAHAVPRAVVCGTMGVGDRKLRLIMAAAPSLGVALASSGDGYFAVTTTRDLDVCIAECRSRMTELAKRAHALESLRGRLSQERRLF